MRILVLTSTFWPVTGGAESYMHNLSGGLARAGHEVVVVTDGSLCPQAPSREVVDGCTVHRLRAYQNEIRRDDRVPWRQLQYSVMHELGSVVEGDFDIVHANSHETVLIGAHIALSLDRPLVASLHEVTPTDAPFGLGRLRMSYGVLPVAAGIAGSQFYYDRARDLDLAADRLHLIYNSVPLREAPAPWPGPSVAGSLGVPPGHRVVLMPARIDPRKDQATMLRAFTRLRSSEPDTFLVIAGRRTDGGYAGQLANLIRAEGLGDNVVFADQLSDAELEVLYQESALVVMCSLQEGLGLAAVEALSYGLPVVVTDVDGLREVVQHEVNGLLVPPRDPVELAAAMRRLLTGPELAAKLGKQAQQTVRDQFDEEQMVARTVEVYRGVIDRRARAAARAAS